MNNGATFNYKKWDSDFFNKAIFDLAVEQVDELRCGDFTGMQEAMIQIKIPATHTALLDKVQSLGFKFIESEVDFSKQIIETRSAPSMINLAASEEIPVIMELAAQAFSFSRFRTPWFQPGDSARFYAQWAKNAVLKIHDDICLKIANKQDDEISGFVTGKRLENAVTRIGLICVTQRYRGQKMGLQLLNSIEQWSLEQGADTIRVATQGSNVAACAFYISHGYAINAINYWFYRGAPG